MLRERTRSGVYSHSMEEYDEPFRELITPEDFLARSPLPADARMMGFDRNTEQGAIIALAASLNPAKTSHRVVAWVMLLALVVPTLLGILSQIF